MYRNYYLYRRQIDFLNTRVKDYSISNCLTHRKDELVLALFHPDQEELLLRINLQVHLPYLLLYPGQKIKDPHIDFFPEIIGKHIIRFAIVPFDKLIHLTIDNYILQMHFFGRHPNVLLIAENKQILDTFKKKSIPADEKKHQLYIDPDAFDHQKFLECTRQGSEFLLLDFFNHHLGGFNTLLSRELCYRCSLDPDLKVHMLMLPDLDLLRQNCATMMNEIKQQPVRIYSDRQQPVQLSLVTLSHLQKDTEFQIFDDVNTAWKKFVFYHQQQIRFIHLSNQLKEVVHNRSSYLRRSLDSMLAGEQLEQRKKEAELKGNLLLTHASKIPKGTKDTELKNIFSASQEFIRIKLNPAKSVQENARKYFEKYKNLDQKRINLSVRQNTFLKEYEYWQELSSKLEHTTSLTQIEKIKKELIERGSMQSGESVNGRKEALDYSFRHLLLGRKWEVFIGKNARNNDLLTFKFANKFDFWFHAQGVSGCHVVLRLGSKNSLPPLEIMEQAASAAAYFSSAKHSHLVPVNYTRVRYVRKAKNMPAGAVLISHEKMLFVKPQKFI